jgi:hypothetical protein
MAGGKKQELITFKVDSALARAMEGVPNRSEFIRAAIAQALGSVCPLCKGTGLMTPDQRRHWEGFSRTHELETCEDCNARHLVCREEPGRSGVDAEGGASLRQAAD